MAEVTPESLVVAQQVSRQSCSLSLRLWQRREEGQCLGRRDAVGNGFPSPEPREDRLPAPGLWGASLHSSAGVYVQRVLWCEDRRGARLRPNYPPTGTQAKPAFQGKHNRNLSPGSCWRHLEGNGERLSRSGVGGIQDRPRAYGLGARGNWSYSSRPHHKSILSHSQLL